MINQFFGSLANRFSFFKRFHLQRIFIVILAGFLVLSATACSNKVDSPQASDTGSYRERVGQPSGVREFSGRSDTRERPSLNTYNDYGQYGSGETSGLSPKAKELVRNAERNVNRQIKDGEDLVDNIRSGKPLDERVSDLSERVGDRAKQFGENVSEGTQENFQTLQDNAESAGRTIQRTARDAT
ncbi:hypothetical protein [Egbenema bharatensis]|uniref:hypothetical protein n=1 Tax=Egbenema bharatensis TaxID=3463334 RepID=UPI003A8820BC